MSSSKQKNSQRKIAISSSMDRAFLNKIIHCKVPCPKSAAVRLEAVTGIDKAIWVFEPERLRELLEEKYPAKEAA